VTSILSFIWASRRADSMADSSDSAIRQGLLQAFAMRRPSSADGIAL
jgi:hypothetical protein